MVPTYPRIHVSLLFGRIKCDGASVALRKRELELMFAVARDRHGITVQRVCELLWPDEEPQAARNVFRVNLARIRRVLGDAAPAYRAGGPLALAPGSTVDLWEIEEALAEICRIDEAHSQMTRLGLLHRRLRDWHAQSAPSWEWFAPTTRHIAEMDHEISWRLGSLCLAAGRVEDALALADRMIRRDPLDEPANELRMRALLALGEQAAAARELRLYAEGLRRELGIEPPESLRSLVAAKT